MTHYTLIRFKRLLLLGAVVAGAIVPAAGAVGRPPDVQDTASANLAAQINRPPDVRDAALGSTVAAADVVERYAATHSRGTGLSTTQSIVSQPPDIRDTAISLTAAAPDVVERFAIAHPYGFGLSSTSSVSRPPDIGDTALAVQYGPAASSSTAFDWGDWAIGIGSGVGLALLLGACLLMSRQLRHRVRTA
jgi:hypothetical protein